MSNKIHVASIPRPKPANVRVPGNPITVQPRSNGNNVNWMPIPAVIPNCPPGLEYLIPLDQILVHQQITSYGEENSYLVMNKHGHLFYKAEESSECCQRFCGANEREFNIKITNKNQQEIIHLYRPSACCLHMMEISSPPGTIIGTVEETCTFGTTFDIKDATGRLALKIVVPFCPTGCCNNNVVFNIYSSNEITLLGHIIRQWSGFKRAWCNADNFKITFHVNLDVKIKAMLLGACFLIDFMYFEKNTKN